MASEDVLTKLNGVTRFGLLAVQGEGEYFAPPGRRRRRTVRCLCDCGNAKDVLPEYLVGGRIKSCGCRRTRTGEANRRHGETVRRGSSPEYNSWKGARQRCENANHPAYPDYGGRGIGVCERWQRFEHFLEDMGRKPSPAHEIDRIDNDGNYEPGNCRWATSERQTANRRVTVFLTYRGERVCRTQLAKRLGVGPDVLARRLAAGMDIEAAIESARRATRGPRAPR